MAEETRLTNATKHRIKAENFINNVIHKSEKPYENLMNDLKLQCEKWTWEMKELNYVNIFDMSEYEYDRRNYLEALLRCADKKIWSYKFNLWKRKV